jgi:phenol 2-monooxygenase (NADPH)
VSRLLSLVSVLNLAASSDLQSLNLLQERLDKDKMPMYGRACTLFPRTLEFFDQLDLLDEFIQEGLIGRTAINYKDGKQVNVRGWQVILSQMGGAGTHLDYCLNLRLKYSERIIQDAYEKVGGKVAVGWELRSLTVDSGASDGYKVSAVVGAVGSDQLRTLKSKYIIGADGGNSTVRRLSGIPFQADKTTQRLVRIDGVVETNMPNSRIGWASIESRTHGNVLWVAIDHGTTRIGFSLNPELYKKYGDKMTEAQAMEEAKASVAPFSLDFKRVDWYTVYG